MTRLGDFKRDNAMVCGGMHVLLLLLQIHAHTAFALHFLHL